MTSIQLFNPPGESLIADFFQQSAGKWRSERRYYTLPDVTTEEVVRIITVRFLEAGSPELEALAQLHQLPDSKALTCGTHVSWERSTSVSGRPHPAGSTVFGALDNILYRDRGYYTPNPVTAQFYFPNPQTLCLKTAYNKAEFEEEIKHIGDRYRTRQTIISRAGEQKTIGQYLEKRLE
ncbi:phycobiliprotein lyase [Phormidium sp. CCY1219]|jgi:hypothetical protein|uniref:phycobiliprotein lyase n=1 Tax=Phormidium sp. CCY1219 TaxID=2886104 RepID=UPI002D1E5FC0|nr:phycobiliprotein lyase [Phormidium sp. CCY1219]MEB3831738.1 phycobiliprotein lyase [Phormidium sp. CCY1219]